MYRLARVALAATSLAVAEFQDCGPPSFEHPLSAPGSSRPDPRILGTWYGTCFGGNERCFLHVFEMEDDRLSMTLVRPDSEDHALTFVSFVSRVGSGAYLNVGLAPEASDSPEAYLIVRYDLGKDGSLGVRLMRRAPVKRAGAAGELAWTIQRPAGRQVADVTSPTPAVAAFVAKSDEGALFEHFGTFRRVRLPTVTDRPRR